MTGVEGRVAAFVREELLAPQGRAGEELGADTSLFRTGIVDSFGLLSLVTFLEQEYGISVRDEEMVPENFDSVATIAAFVARRSAGKGGAT
ncbi:MAG TPA: acyl carrier protein [Candidatus Limnocylindria bacterium]|nr:acyl carrier protein [Candidatus Limnocylindria bacterium]